jgi:hypothetical protein
MSIHPQGKSCPDLGSSACSQWPSYEVDKLAQTAVTDGPSFLRKMALSWSDNILSM